MGKYLDTTPVSGRTPKTPEKFKKWNSLDSFPKILKNNKYYKKIFGEIGFQKFNSDYKLKLLESTRETGRHQIQWNFDKFRKFLEKVFR